MNRYLTSFVEVKDPTPSPSPVPSPFSPDQQPHPSETVTELDQRHQPIPKKTDLRPMYVRPNEKDEKDTHVTLVQIRKRPYQIQVKLEMPSV